jgi:hypothetical protein
LGDRGNIKFCKFRLPFAEKPVLRIDGLSTHPEILKNQENLRLRRDNGR